MMENIIIFFSTQQLFVFGFGSVLGSNRTRVAKMIRDLNVSSDMRREVPVWLWCARVVLFPVEQRNIFSPETIALNTKKILRPFAISYICSQSSSTKQLRGTVVST